MHLIPINIDKFSENLSEVSSPKILENHKFSKDSLFSQQIFGPIQSYKCACIRSVYRGPHSGIEKCKICGVDITSSEERNRRYAKIVLPFPILNPTVYMLIMKSKPSIKRNFDNLLYYKNKFIINDSGDLVKLLPEHMESGEVKEEDILFGLDGAVKYIEYLSENVNKKEFKFISKHLDILKINNVIVNPAAFRNYSKNKNKTYNMDKLNKFYVEILIRVKQIKNLPYKLDENHEVYKIFFRNIQYFVIGIFDYVIERMSKKNGLLRQNILGKRIDFSARCVISPNPELKLTECSLPYFVVLEVFKPMFTVYLVDRKVCKLYNEAFDLITDCLIKKKFDLFNYLEEFVKNRMCIINRQPTLHRLSMLAFYIRLNKGNTAQLHPLICSPLNADFDGDAISLYFEMSNQVRDDIKKTTAIWNNLISPSDANLVCLPNQDIILGIFEVTKN